MYNTKKGKHMNVKAFYDTIRLSLFKGGALTQGVVDTTNEILAACNKYDVHDYRHIGYCLCTGYHESYSKSSNPEWKPVREGFASTNQGAINAVTSLFNRGIISKNYALPDANGHSYYGRSHVQITHKSNYSTMGKRLGVDLVNNPDLALERKYAAEILVVGLKEGLFTGKALENYFSDKHSDPVNARRIVNGTDKADLIARYFADFYTAIISL